MSFSDLTATVELSNATGSIDVLLLYLQMSSEGREKLISPRKDLISILEWPHLFNKKASPPHLGAKVASQGHVSARSCQRFPSVLTSLECY